MLLPRFERPISKATDVESLKLLGSDGVVTNGNGTMVTIITEKLRNQTLDDCLQFAPIPQTRRSWDLAPTRGSSRISHVKGEKDWPQYAQSSDHYRPQGEDPQLPPAYPTACSNTESRSHLQPSTPQKAAPPPAIATQLPPLTTASVTTTQQMMVVGKGISYGGTTSVSSKTPPLMCFHHKSLMSCAQGEVIPGTPPDPPKKRHCRSLSIPGDVKTVKSNTNKSGSKWQPQASSIWKPVALRPHRHGKVHHHSGPTTGSLLTKSRHSPTFSVHGAGKTRLLSSPSNCMMKTKGNSHPQQPQVASAANSQNHYYPLQQQQMGTDFSPTVHVFTGSDYTAGNVAVTPPESPAPRPASASSGFYDSSASQTSLTSLNVSWTEGYFNSQGCFSPHPPPNRSTSSQSGFHRQGDGFRWVRSLSVEGPNSFGEDTTKLRANSASGEVAPPSERPDKRCVSGDGSLEASSRAARSMPVINLSANSTPRTAPWSPRRHRMPRCRSQPCVMTERKCGVKRRRDEERPSLNLNKMTETAYPPSVHQNRPKSVTFAQDIQEAQRCSRFGLYNELESYHVLDPIASSPLDPPHGFSQMAAAAQVSQGHGNTVTTHNISDNREINSTNRTVFSNTNNPSQQGVAPHTGSIGNRLTIPTVGQAFRRNLNDCSSVNGKQTSQRIEEIQWDSGCSDTNDPPDLISFSESSENSYSFHDEPQGVATEAETLEDSQQFDLEMGSELDLDQIEKD